MEVNLIVEALKFMVLGMGVVYLFLIIMIQSVKLQAFIIGKYFPDEDPVAIVPSAQATGADEQARVAAVIAAVTEFRKNKS
jgi:oxaloacetate decarboxylase gamma subunit